MDFPQFCLRSPPSVHYGPVSTDTAQIVYPPRYELSRPPSLATDFDEPSSTDRDFDASSLTDDKEDLLACHERPSASATRRDVLFETLIGPYTNYIVGVGGAALLLIGLALLVLAIYAHFVGGSVIDNPTTGRVQLPGLKLFRGRCNQLSKANTALHLVLNVIGTLVLGLSSLVQQLLTSITEPQLLAAVETSWTGYTFGNNSVARLFRNTGTISKVGWLVMVMTSIPAHAFINSIVGTILASSVARSSPLSKRIGLGGCSSLLLLSRPHLARCAHALARLRSPLRRVHRAPVSGTYSEYAPGEYGSGDPGESETLQVSPLPLFVLLCVAGSLVLFITALYLYPIVHRLPVLNNTLGVVAAALNTDELVEGEIQSGEERQGHCSLGARREAPTKGEPYAGFKVD